MMVIIISNFTKPQIKPIYAILSRIFCRAIRQVQPGPRPGRGWQSQVRLGRVRHREIRDGCLVTECRSEEALADTGGSGDEDGGTLVDVFACGKLHDAPLVTTECRIEDDLFDAGVVAEPGVLDQPRSLVCRTLVVLGLDEHHESVLEGDLLVLPRFLKVLPAFCHAGQMKTLEVLEDLIFHFC